MTDNKLPESLENVKVESIFKMLTIKHIIAIVTTIGVIGSGIFSAGIKIGKFWGGVDKAKSIQIAVKECESEKITLNENISKLSLEKEGLNIQCLQLQAKISFYETYIDYIIAHDEDIDISKKFKSKLLEKLKPTLSSVSASEYENKPIHVNSTVGKVKVPSRMIAQLQREAEESTKKFGPK